jgi:hypothetical protein
MRLIDADALLESLIKCKELGRNSFGLVTDVIRNQPTVCDVDKVVNELEEWSFEAKILLPTNNELGKYEEEVEREVICTKNAVEIVKGGGTEC